MEGIIVGIDPGTKSSICVLDLNGNLKSIVSGKNISLEAAAKYISSQGDPIFVATDVTKVGDFVEKVAAIFSAQIHMPSEKLSNLEKNSIIQDFLKSKKIKIKNKHEAASLLAALVTYSYVKNRIEHIDKKMREFNFEENYNTRNYVKKMILRGTQIKRAMEIFK